MNMQASVNAGVVILTVSALTMSCSIDLEGRGNDQYRSCTALDHLAVVTWDLKTYGPTSTATELKAKVENIASVNDDVQTSGSTFYLTDRVNASTAELSELAETVQNGDAPATAWQSLQPAVEQLSLNAQQALSASVC